MKRKISLPETSPAEVPIKYAVQHINSALSGYINCYRFQPYNLAVDPIQMLHDCTQMIYAIIQIELERQPGLKVWLCLKIIFEKSVDPSETMSAYFGSCQLRALRGQPIILHECFPIIINSIEAFEQKGSNWIIRQISNLDMHICHYNPLSAKSYIRLPKYLFEKKAIVNVKNQDNYCFMWSVLAALFPQKQHPERVDQYKRYTDRLNFSGINFPVFLDSIPKFEFQNRLAINVYGYHNSIYPLYISALTEVTHINILLYKGHYCFVKNLNRLLSDQNRHNGCKFFCHRCLFPKYSVEGLKAHLKDCTLQETTARIRMPKISKLKFQNYARSLRLPVVIYADCECLTSKISTCKLDPSNSYTVPYQEHVPCSFGYVKTIGCCAEVRYEPVQLYRGQDCVEWFLSEMILLAKEHDNLLNNPKTMQLSSKDWKQYKASLNCHICDHELNFDKVRDHCHICGKFRGAAHSECNILFRLKREIVVVFHNLRRYDGHIIMQHIGLACNKANLRLTCIAKAIEDYVTFTLHCGRQWRIRFIDSCQFLLSSLDNLSKSLSFDNLHAVRSQLEPSHVQLALRKGVYPYSYMDSWDKFSEKQLPSQSSFYNDLIGEDVTAEDYSHAQNVWLELNIKDLGEYHDFYLKTDALLLTDVFENFRRFCLQNYLLDPCHYCTLPSFGWDACLRLTQVELELLSCPDMYSFFESGIRGGISMISHRYARANNKDCPDYDLCLPTSYIMYLDANNLYGWSMVQPLPVAGFQWLSDEDIACIEWTTKDMMGDYGYVLEVDLFYPPSLHNLHNSYPLAAERMNIDEDMLSPFSRKLYSELNISYKTSQKLVPNLNNKQNYILHGRNLQLYLTLGMKLLNVHRVLKFEQKPWMQPYIMFNTEKRKKATSSFEKDLFKLLNNAVFGKTMENVRAYMDVKLITTPSSFKKLVADPRYQRCSIFSQNLVAVCMRRRSVLLHKPIYVGFSVLELSKTLMYSFHYNYMVSRYPIGLRLLFTDTDSLCYHVQTDDVYHDMLADSEHIDTSDYPAGHFLHCEKNKKVLGKMKDETAGVPIDEFVGLRSKMYSFRCNREDKKRAKGVKKAVVKKRISHEDFKETLFGRKVLRHEMNSIRNQKHKIYSIIQNKISLSAYDDKRYLLDDGISSYAYGHFMT